jgi:hypothetical protein
MHEVDFIKKKNLTFVNKDERIAKKELPDHIIPGSTEAKLFLLNFNSVSENSKLLVLNG